MELSVLITISTIIAFIMAWFLLKVGLSLWIAMPITRCFGHHLVLL